MGCRRGYQRDSRNSDHVIGGLSVQENCVNPNFVEFSARTIESSALIAREGAT